MLNGSKESMEGNFFCWEKDDLFSHERFCEYIYIYLHMY